MPNIIPSPCSARSSTRKSMEHETENRALERNSGVSDAILRQKCITPTSEETCSISSRGKCSAQKHSSSVNVKKMQRMFKKATEDNIQSIKSYVTELKERVAKLQHQKQLLVCQIYMEFEHRRLKWLEQHLDDLGNASPALLGDDPAGSVSSSIKALKQEREYLAKRVSSKLTVERESLYMKWEIPPEGKQRRRLQLVNKLWTDPLDMQHVKESAQVVAKIVGFCESGQPILREMFELNFVPLGDKTWMGWNLISNLLHL